MKQRQEKMLLMKLTNTKQFWKTFDEIKINSDKRSSSFLWGFKLVRRRVTPSRGRVRLSLIH